PTAAAAAGPAVTPADPAAAAAADPAAAAAAEPTAAAAADPAAAAVAEPAAAAAAASSCSRRACSSSRRSRIPQQPPPSLQQRPPPVLAIDAEGRPVKFDTWLDDLHLFLQLTAKEDISLYDHALGHATAPDTTADSTLRSQWQTRDAHARFAIRNSLPLDEREHFGQCKTAKELYTAVVARYSSPASAALGRLSLPYLFPDLASFHTVADLITHLKTSEARFRAAMPAELLASNPPRSGSLSTTLSPASLTLCAHPAPPSLRGVPLPPFSPLSPLLVLSTSLVLRRSGPRLLRAGAAGPKEARVEVAAGEAGVEAVGVEEGLERLVAAVGVVTAAAEAVAGAGAAAGAAVVVAAAGEGVVEEVAAAVVVVEALAVVRASSTLRRSRRPTCGKPHPTPRCFARLDDAWRTQFPDGNELPRWFDLEKKGVDIWALDFDAILTAMYAMFTSGEGAQYLRVPPDPGILTSEAAALGASASAAPGARVSATPGDGEAATLGAGESVSPGTESTAALHTFTLDSGASRCFFRDRTALEPLARPVAVSLADPSGGPVIATSSTVLPCPAVPSGTLSGLYLPSFSTNLVAGSALQDGGVHQFTPAYERVTHCTCARTGRHLATFTREPGSDLYTLTTESPQVAVSASASASGQLSAPCSCRSLAHETVLWHHRLGHPSMHKRDLVAGLPRVLPPLPPSPAPPCLPCVEGRQRAAPHSSSFPLTTAPLQTLHLDVWGPARVRGQGQERYFLIVVDDFSRYTTVFPLRTKGDVPDVLIPWIRRSRLQLSKHFHSNFPVLRLHSDRGGEFSSGLLEAFCQQEGIEQSFTLPASPQQNGVAERRIGLVMEVARTSLVHAAAPHFLWPFAVRYAAHQLNLWPRVSLPETSPTLRWTGEAGDASRFRVWGSRAFVRDTSTDKLSRRAVPCVFLGFVDPGEPVEVAVDSRPARGAEPGGAEPGGAASGGAESGGAESGGAEPERTTPGGALSSRQLQERYLQYCRLRRGTTGARTSTSPPAQELPPIQQIREWYTRRCSLRSGAPGAADPGVGAATGAEDPGVGAAAGTADPSGGAAAGAEDPGVGAAAGAADPSGGAAAGAEDPDGGAATGAEDPGGGAAAGAEDPSGGAAAGAEDPDGGAAAGAEDLATGVSAGSGDAARPRPYFVPLLQQVLGQAPPPCPPPSVECPPPVQPQSQLPPASPLPAPSPYTGPTGGLTERREPASRPASPVRTARTGRRVPRERPPPVPGTHYMTLRPSTAPQRVPLPSPPASSLPTIPDPESDYRRAASPTVTRLLATVVTDPTFESSAASALVAELVDFAARCRLDYATSLVAESESVCPPSVGGECALGTDVLEDRQEEFQCFAAALPRLVSMLVAPEGDPDAPDIPTPRSYAEAMAGPYSSQVKRPPGNPPVFKARYVARGFSQREGVDFFQTFSPTPKMTTLRVLLHIAAQRDYELHSLDFSTAFLEGSLHEEIWLRRPPGFTGSVPPGTQWRLQRPVYGLRQAPREWHDTLRTTLAALGFAPSTADPSLFLRTDTSLPPFYILVYVDDLVFATADTAALAHVKSELQRRHTCTDLGELTSYLGLRITRDRARRTITLTQSHMVQQILQRFRFTYSSPQSTPLPTGHSLSALPSDESVEPSGPYPELVGCLMYLMTCTRPDLAYPLSILACYVAPGRHRKEHMDAAKRVLRYLCSTSGMGLVLGGRDRVVLTGHSDASWADDQATQRSSQGYTFSLGSGSVSWRSTHSSSVLSSSCEAETYATAMAAQELRWLTYLLTDLGERPRSPPVLYVDNKAAIALCEEHRLEHRTKHIALRYFLARELQQRGQLCLRYVATEANTADVFTKALQPCDHQRFCTLLGLVPTGPHLLTS
ncbi:unnamed protein product, partial [Closterium sp. Yama58-4]